MQELSINTKKTYNAIDLTKFLCAYLVMMIHIEPFGTNEKFANISFIVQNCATRIAVPFFFIASGFFFYRKNYSNNFDWSNTKKYALKLIRLYFIWSAIYFPLCIKTILHNEKGMLKGLLLYLRDFVFAGSYAHLWYLPASVVGVLIVSFLISKNINIKSTLILAAVLYCIGLLGQTWFGLIRPIETISPSVWNLLKMVKEIIYSTRNGLFEAFLFIALGMLFAYKKIELKKGIAILGFALSYIMMFLELYFVRKNNFSRAYDMFVFVVPATFFLFYIAKNTNLNDKPIYSTMRKMSSLIYFMHPLIGAIISKSLSIIHIDANAFGLKFVGTLFVTTFVSFMIIKISNIKRLGWIKYLYS